MPSRATAVLTVAAVVGAGAPGSVAVFRWTAASAAVLLVVGRYSAGRDGTREIDPLATLSGLPDLVEKRSRAGPRPSSPGPDIVPSEFQ